MTWDGAFRENVEARRFEQAEDGAIVFADISRTPGRIVIHHVETPRALRGRGAAGRLMAAIAAKARAEGARITPLCGYAAKWLDDRPEWADLLG